MRSTDDLKRLHRTYEARFKGWLPTVSGRLSFSVFGYADHPSKVVSANVADGKTRIIICYQKRNLSDSLFGEYFARAFFGLSGKFWFALLARADDCATAEDSPLEGHLFLFHERQLWRKEAEVLVRPAQRDLRAFESMTGSMSLSSYFGSHFTDLASSLASLSSFNARFQTQRDGETLIDIPALSGFSSNSPAFPDDEPQRGHIIHAVTSQLFYFLRDVGHVHQHHNPSTDTVVNLHLFDGKDDLTWRCETLRALYRKVLEYKRRKDVAVYGASLGVLAYAEAFERACNERLNEQITDGSYKVQPIIFKELLEKSITASQWTLNQQTQEGIRQSDTYRNTLISVLTVLLALVGLLQISGPHNNLAKPSETLIWLGNTLLCNPLTSAVFVALIVSLVLHGIGVIDISRWTPVRWMVRFFQAFGKSNAGYSLIVVAAIIGCLTVGYVTSVDLGKVGASVLDIAVRIFNRLF